MKKNHIANCFMSMYNGANIDYMIDIQWYNAFD